MPTLTSLTTFLIWLRCLLLTTLMLGAAHSALAASNSFAGSRNGYRITSTDTGYAVKDSATGISTALTSPTALQFTDVTVNLGMGELSKTIAASDLQTLIELYVAFFNRVPDADGLAYWIGQFKGGMSLNQIADSFYAAAIEYASVTGYSAGMSHADFVRIIYDNVLGRDGPTAPSTAEVDYWANKLADGSATRGSLLSIMLASAHGYVGDPVWGSIPKLLDNKVTVARIFAIERGLTYNTPIESVIRGMAIAAAVTASGIDSAISLIGITDPGFNLLLPPPLVSSITPTAVLVNAANRKASASVTASLATASVSFAGNRSGYSITKTSTGYSVKDNATTSSTAVPAGQTSIQFADVTVNLLIGDVSKTIKAEDLQLLIELYVAFFNRVPDADGLAYWIEQFKNGSMTLDQIADFFYYTAVTNYPKDIGYSSNMTDADFVRIIYKNVLGRYEGFYAPPENDIQFWADRLATRQSTKGELVHAMLWSAHTLVGDPVFYWVPLLLDNKIRVATIFTLDQGLTYNTPTDSIKKGMAIAAAVTSSGIDAAIGLIGITDTAFHLIAPLARVTSITPTAATLAAPIQFTISGQNLPLTAVMTLASANCDTPTSRTATGFSVVCTPNATGSQTATVKTGTGGTQVYASQIFLVQIESPTCASTEELINGYCVTKTAQIDAITPLTATVNVASTLTVTGQNLPLTAVMALADATCQTPTNRTTTRFTVVCTPQASGNKAATVQTGIGSTQIYALQTYLVVVQPPVCASTEELIADKCVTKQPKIDAITPLTATVNVASTFTVTGQNLPLTAVMALADAACQTPTGRTTTRFTVVCTPQASGNKAVTIQTDTGGVPIAASQSYLVTVQPPTCTATQDLIGDQCVDKTISLESITPMAVMVNAANTFTVTGQNLPLTAVLFLGDSQCQTQTGSSSHSFRAICTATTAGSETAMVRTDASQTDGGTLIDQVAIRTCATHLILVNGACVTSSKLLPLMVDSYGREVPEADFGGGDSNAAGADGTAGDGAPITNALVTLVDQIGKIVTTLTDSQGYFRVAITGLTPPFAASVNRTDGTTWESIHQGPVVSRGFINVNLTGLTDKIVSDVILNDSANSGSSVNSASSVARSVPAPRATAVTNTASVGRLIARLGPAELERRLKTAKSRLKAQLSAQLTQIGMTTKFDPVTTPFKAVLTDPYDKLLELVSVTKDTATGSTTVLLRYPLGGTISGLTGAGLVLANNNQTVTVSPIVCVRAPCTTDFVFPKGLPAGTAYNVTVQTQPAGQTCTVSSGSGTMPAAHVNKVAVNCVTTAVYTLSGSLSTQGALTGLVLTSNGQKANLPTIVCSTNCPKIIFAFPSGLPAGTAYDVTVQSQPTTGLTCTVSNGSGVMPAANVTSVAVNCSKNSPSTLGGTVTNLSGRVTLGSNGQTVTVDPPVCIQLVGVVCDTSAFTFPTPIAAGTAYSVMVLSQPEGQTCTVSNGAGTMAGAPVTNVVVTCRNTGAYTLGGTVTGYSLGSGLVLSTGTQSVAVSAYSILCFTLPCDQPPTSFVFFTALASGIAYKVTVQTQPTGLTCTVTNGSGTMPAANVSTVQVTCVTSTPASRYSKVGNYLVTDCVKDTTTGLIWEGKPTSGLRASTNKYTNFDSTTALQYWNGSTYIAAQTQSQIDAASNSIGYKNAVNASALCGYADWRLPTKTELLGLVFTGMRSPAIDTTWFPNTQSWYWTSTPYGNYGGGDDAWGVGFSVGSDSGNLVRNNNFNLRLVR